MELGAPCAAQRDASRSIGEFPASGGDGSFRCRRCLFKRPSLLEKIGEQLHR
jgi:hypothetical protein